jgi:PAS domain S-box-containing protein
MTSDHSALRTPNSEFKKQLRVLIVEDSEDDAILLIRELRNGGYDVLYERVETRESLKAALEQKQWDLIISDYIMPNFSGVAALHVLKDKEIDLPFIIVSGNIGEDVAVSAMKEGVHDYLVKGRLKRLIPAIERELREAEIRRGRRLAEKTIREQSDILNSIFKYTITPLVLLDRDFNFLRVNEAYAKSCARDIDEFRGHNHFEFYPHEENEAIFRKVVKEKFPYRAIAKPFVFPDHPEWGITYWDWTLTPLLDTNGEVNFLVFALNEVTERKQAENELREHERLLTTVLDNLPVGVWTLDREGNIIQGNPAGREIWGDLRYVGINQFVQYKGWWLDTGKLIEPDEWGAVRAIQKGEVSLNEEIEIESFDGTRRIILYSATPLFDDERNITGAVVVNQDITNRKKAEEVIRSERQRLYSVLEKLPAYVYLLTPDYTFAYVNQEFKKIFGDPGDRKCYEHLFNCQEPCEECQTCKILTEHKDEQQWEWVGPNGNTYAIYDHAFSDIDGSPLILEMGLDVTDRKRALDHLGVTSKLLEFFVTTRGRKEYLTSVVDLLREWTECNCIGVRVLDNLGNIPYESYTGFSREFWEAENWISVKNDQCACIRVVLQKPDPQELSMMTPNGSFYCNETAEFERSLTEQELSRYRGMCILTGYKSVAIVPIRYQRAVIGAVHIADKRAGMVPIEKIEFIESLTLPMGEAMSRFSAEEALLKSETRLAEAERIALLGNWEWDIGNDVITFSDELYQIFDMKPEDFHPTYEAFLHLIHPDDLENVRASIKEAVRERRPFDMDFRFMRNDGAVRVMHGRAEITYDLSGRPLLVRGTGQDITDRVKAEKALRESEERYRTLIETMNEGLGMDDENGLLVYANDRLCEMLGYSLDEIIGRPVLSFFDEKNQKVLREQVEKRMSGENASYRLEWVKKDGQKIITLVSPRGIFNSAGKYRGSFAVITDVTEKLRLESIAQAVNTMDNIGFIFSGVRHEIGNPVNSIKMALSVLKQNLDSYSKETIKEYADRMLSEIVRMEYLLKAMKSFNLFETIEPIDINMTTFLDDFLRLTTGDFAKRGIRIETDIAKTLWAYIDPRAFQQVLLNVMTNASDALNGRENGRITVRASKLRDMINISVEDNGSGMSEDQVEDLFKPFYTTKEKGTGLGLVISKKMMTKMKGFIEVISEKDKGTIVDLFVPEGISE